MAYSVRPASESDVEIIANYIARLKTLNEELDPHYEAVEELAEVTKKYVEDGLKDETKILLVAEHEEDGVVGVIKVDIVDRLFYKPRLKGVITDIYVHPSHRRRSVGKLLLEKAVEQLRNRGVKLVSAVYPEGNIISRKFYEKNGFVGLNCEVYKPLD